MPSIIDTNRDTSKRLTQLRAAGVATIIRYYARAMSDKVVRRAEAQAIGAAGMRLAIVYEGAGDRLSAFSEAFGYKDAAFSRSYGHDVIHQPAGSAVYFAVDFDAIGAEIRNAIIPYFRGVARAFAEDNGLPVYRVGVYGSGTVCQAVLDAGLAELAWLSCSTGWSGYRAFLLSGRWNLKQHTPSTVASLDVDVNDPNPQRPDIGDFLPGAAVPQPQPKPPPAIVVPRDPPPPRRFERLQNLLGQLRRLFQR